MIVSTFIVQASFTIVTYDRQNMFIIQATGVNVIKLFSFVTDDKAQCVRGFALGNPFQSGLRI